MNNTMNNTELLRTLDVNEDDLNMRDLSTDIASELSTEDIEEEEEEIIHKDSNAELNQEQFEDTFTKLMEDRHAEDTATIQGAMASNNDDKPAAAAASTGGSAAAASMPFPGVPQQPIEPPPVEEVPTTFPPTEELDNSGGNTGGSDAKGEGGGEGEEEED